MPYAKEHIQAYVKNVISQLKNNIYENKQALHTVCYATKEPLSYDNRFQGKRIALCPGDTWGELFDCAWFNFTGTVPPDCAGKHVVALIDVGGEACIYDKNGVAVRGLTSMEDSFDIRGGLAGKRVYQLSDNAQGGELINIWADAGVNDLFGGMSCGGALKMADIAVCRDELRNLFYDFQVLYDLLVTLEGDSARSGAVLFCLKDACDVLTDYNTDTVARAKQILYKELSKKGGDYSLKINAIGHSHLDLAWLWPIRETKRKALRTMSTVIDLMDRYEDYMFCISQPQMLEWIEKSQPQLFNKINKRVTEGRIELTGGMWVESDTNIPSGESLIRQILYGKKYIKEKFNKDTKTMWLPDVFGYTAALPQIMKGCGLEYFMTQKLSWNEHNKFPHQTFNWQGLDGTTVVSHMPPEECYNSAASPSMAKWLERNHRDNGVCDEALMLFGIGDGGGGPGPEHLERLSRMKDMAQIAPVSQGSVEHFFDRLAAKKEKYPVWAGELYLEKHQGTYTTCARNKWYNRKIEYLLHELEFAYVLSGVTPDKDFIEKTYKEVLLYQFHDILPGSSIKRVYEECTERYELIYNKLNEKIKNIYQELANNVCTDKGKLVIFNSMYFERNPWIQANGEFYKITVPALGYAVIDTEKEKQPDYYISANVNVLENNRLKVVFNTNGSIKSVYDKKKNKSVLKGDENGRLAVYEDNGDSWDFSMFYRNRKIGCFELIASKCYTQGPYAIMKQHYKYGQSTLCQNIILCENSSRLDFECKLDFKEEDKMLRVSFDTNIFAENAVFDIQFGKITRPLHQNTSWDMAQIEKCAHKYAEITQPDYSVALINDSKYGYYASGSTLDLNLIRCVKSPGSYTDLGEHTFTYSLYPHEKNKEDISVLQQAYELNSVLYASSSTQAGSNPVNSRSLFNISGDTAVIETIKPGENSDSYVIRIYEPDGCDAKLSLKANFDYSKAYFCDMLENNICEAESDNELNIRLKPFEVKTIKFEK